MKKVTIEIAGVSCEFTFSSSNSYVTQVLALLPGFIAESKPYACFEVTVNNALLVNPVKGAYLHKTAIDTFAFKADGAHGHYNCQNRQGSLSVLSDPISFHRALRIIYSHLLPETGGALFHAAAVNTEAGAEVYFGPSDAGKTTIARKANRAGKVVLADELAAINRTETGYAAFSTPFWGEYKGASVAGGHPVRAFIKPLKAKQYSLVHLNRTGAVVGLMQTMLCFASDHETNGRLLDIAASITARVPVQAMEFNLSDNLWEKRDAGNNN